MESKEVIEFYDDYGAGQLRFGINDRIYHLYKKLIQFGLKRNSNVLELGSGIGTMTFLLSKYVTKGKIEAVDISPRSIEFSKSRIRNSNILFTADDIVKYKPSCKNFQFITLFDVIEHIPILQHYELFKNIAAIANEKTIVLINIPNPAYLEFAQNTKAETLQVIDQPVPLGVIVDNLEKTGLVLTFFETYSIWVENDYQFLVIKKKDDFREVTLSSKRTFFQKALKKLERAYIQRMNNYR